MTYLVLGVINGLLFALIAVCLIFVFEATGILNFALGGFGMFAAYSFSALVTSGTAAWTALAVVLVGAAVFGLLLGAATSPARQASTEVKAVASLAVLVAAQGLVVAIWGVNPRSAPSLISGTLVRVGDVAITYQRLVAALVAIGGSLMIVWFLKRTMTGSAIRAMANSDEVSRLIGLPARRLWTQAWVLSSLIITVGIVTALPDIGVSVGQLSFVVLTPLAAVLLAGFRSIPLAIAVSFGLGLAQGLVGNVSWLAPYRDALPLVVVVLGVVFSLGRSSTRADTGAIGSAG